jgi:hypothetical protein
MHRSLIGLSSFLLLLTACPTLDDKDVTSDDTGSGEIDGDGDGFTLSAGDCNDDDAAIHPDADEICDSVDNNCDGEIDEDAAVDAATFYADSDSDSYGDAASYVTA